VDFQTKEFKMRKDVEFKDVLKLFEENGWVLLADLEALPGVCQGWGVAVFNSCS
jgi:hypothetical protein